jgi:hypothetical protein
MILESFDVVIGETAFDSSGGEGPYRPAGRLKWTP